MKSKKRMLTGLAAAGVLAGALAGGGVALADTGAAHPAATVAAVASASATGKTGTAAGQHVRFAHRARLRRMVVRISASYLGLKPAELRAQLRSGQTLAQVATAHGKSASGLENAIVARADKRIDRGKKLSAARKAELIADVKANVGAFVNAEHPLGRDLRHLERKAGIPLGSPTTTAPASSRTGGTAE